MNGVLPCRSYPADPSPRSAELQLLAVRQAADSLCTPKEHRREYQLLYNVCKERYATCNCLRDILSYWNLIEMFILHSLS